MAHVVLAQYRMLVPLTKFRIPNSSFRIFLFGGVVMQEKKSPGQRLVHFLLSVLLGTVLVAAFFLAVILGHPQGDGSNPAEAQQPLLPPMTAPAAIQSLNGLQTLLDAFPAPVMASLSSTAMDFVRGACTDVPFEDGYARVVSLTYQTREGETVTVESIYPARALDVMGKGDYVISATAGHPLAGLRSILMERDGGVRMHAQSGEALYVVTLPGTSSAALRQLTSTLLLYGGNQDE